MRILFFDLEIFPNYFLVVIYNPYKKEYYTFQLWELDGKIVINDIDKLLKFLEEEKDSYFCGYNSLGYDMNILTEIVNKKLTKVSDIKLFNDILINSEWAIYRENELCNKTIDLMLVNNYGPKSARPTSLKKLEFNLRKKKIQDLPYHFNDILTKETEIAEVIKYCKYDVEVTLDVFNLSKDLINLRVEFGFMNGLDLINSTEPDIAKKYMLKQLSSDLNITESAVKKLKTYNDQICVKDCLLPYIKEYTFKNKTLGSALEFYENIILEPSVKSTIIESKKIINLKKAISKIIPYYDGEIIYAAGGLHFSTKAGVYESNEEYVIIDWDKVSFYPHFGMKHGVSPAHLGDSYSKFLLNTFNERKKYNKKTHPIINHSLKIILNSSYGG